MPILARLIVQKFVAEVYIARRYIFKPGHHSERGRLAATRRSYDYYKFIFSNIEIKIIYRFFAVGINLFKMF